MAKRNLALYFFFILLALHTINANTLSEGEESDSDGVDEIDELVVSDVQNDTIISNATDTEAKATRTSPKKMTCLPFKGLNQTVIFLELII